MSKQAEARLVSSIKKYLNLRQPEALCWKLADRFTRGLPDLIFIGRDKGGEVLVLGIECKTQSGKISKLQEVMLEKFETIDNGKENILYIVARSVNEIKDVCEYHGI